MTPFFGSGLQQVLGQTAFKDTVVYSPWVPRGGLAATFSIEVLGRSSNGNLSVTVQHKNRIQTDGDATSAGTAITANTIAVHSDRYTSLKELIRYQFTVSGSTSIDWSHFRDLEPAWETQPFAIAPFPPI